MNETDADLQSDNISIYSAWIKANNCALWQHIINPGTLHWGHDNDDAQTGATNWVPSQ